MTTCGQYNAVRCPLPCGQCAEKLCPVIHMDVRAISHLLVKPALHLFSLDEYSLTSCCLWYHSATQFALHCIDARLVMSAMSQHSLLPCRTDSAAPHILCFLSPKHIMQLQPYHRISQARAWHISSHLCDTGIGTRFPSSLVTLAR